MASSRPDRIIFKDHPDSLEITIPAKGNWPVIVVLIMISIFWWFTGGNKITVLTDTGDAEPIDWVWICWGAALILIILRNLWLALAVKEKVMIKSGILTLKKQGHPLVFTKKYELAKIKYFSTDEDSNTSLFDNPLSNDVGSGTVCFGYDKNNIRFGEGLSETDANYILQELKERGVLIKDNL